MTVRKRHAVLAIASAVTLAMTVWASLQDDVPAAVARPARSAVTTEKREAPSATPAAHDAQASQTRTAFPPARADLFSAHTWTPRVSDKPAAASAPVMPYTYFGRMTEDGTLYVFLQRGERNYTAKRGDVLDRVYRIDEITPAAILMTYLPLMQRQTLHTGS